MIVTRTSAPFSARAANSPPKPDPTITTWGGAAAGGARSDCAAAASVKPSGPGSGARRRTPSPLEDPAERIRRVGGEVEQRRGEDAKEDAGRPGQHRDGRDPPTPYRPAGGNRGGRR